MNDELINPDRDDKHRRRREAGSGDDDPNGRAVAEALYGGNPSALDGDEEPEREPTLFTDEDDDMAHPNVDRSKRHEREIVHAAEDVGLTAERAWNSDGRSLGEHEECDVRITTGGGTTWTVQAKRRKTVADYLTCEDADVVVTREDRGENLAIVPLDLFLDLLLSGQTGTPRGPDSFNE